MGAKGPSVVSRNSEFLRQSIPFPFCSYLHQNEDTRCDDESVSLSHFFWVCSGGYSILHSFSDGDWNFHASAGHQSHRVFLEEWSHATKQLLVGETIEEIRLMREIMGIASQARGQTGYTILSLFSSFICLFIHVVACVGILPTSIIARDGTQHHKTSWPRYSMMRDAMISWGSSSRDLLPIFLYTLLFISLSAFLFTPSNCSLG